MILLRRRGTALPLQAAAVWRSQGRLLGSEAGRQQEGPSAPPAGAQRAGQEPSAALVAEVAALRRSHERLAGDFAELQIAAFGRAPTGAAVAEAHRAHALEKLAAQQGELRADAAAGGDAAPAARAAIRRRAGACRWAAACRPARRVARVQAYAPTVPRAPLLLARATRARVLNPAET